MLYKKMCAYILCVKVGNVCKNVCKNVCIHIEDTSGMCIYIVYKGRYSIYRYVNLS